jgi:hypothetical protein
VATAIVAGATAAAVVVIVVIAVIASALTSGNSTPQAFSGNTGPAAASNSSGLPSCDSNGDTGWTGTAALPVSASSIALSFQQQIAACEGNAISVTCSGPSSAGSGEVMYLCTIPEQESTEYVLGTSHPIDVSVATGVWVDKAT